MYGCILRSGQLGQYTLLSKLCSARYHGPITAASKGRLGRASLFRGLYLDSRFPLVELSQ